MKVLTFLAVAAIMTGVALGDELVLKDGKKIEWTNLKDLGESFALALHGLAVVGVETGSAAFACADAFTLDTAPIRQPSTPKRRRAVERLPTRSV